MGGANHALRRSKLVVITSFLLRVEYHISVRSHGSQDVGAALFRRRHNCTWHQPGLQGAQRCPAAPLLGLRILRLFHRPLLLCGGLHHHLYRRPHSHPNLHRHTRWPAAHDHSVQSQPHPLRLPSLLRPRRPRQRQARRNGPPIHLLLARRLSAGSQAASVRTPLAHAGRHPPRLCTLPTPQAEYLPLLEVN